MTSELASRNSVSVDLQEKALLGGDLSKMTPGERLSYYNHVCQSLDLNPLTRPFEYVTLNGKLQLYARKDCTEQLRSRRGISIVGLHREVVEGTYVVTARAQEGSTMRTDESIGAVPIEGLKGEARSNAMMKAETKAKRRVTLSICGLGMLDETEIDSVPQMRSSHSHEAKTKIAELARDGIALPDAPVNEIVLPPAEHDDPTTPYLAQLRACEPTNAAINKWWGTVPESLKQDLFDAYNQALRSIAKGKK